MQNSIHIINKFIELFGINKNVCIFAYKIHYLGILKRNFKNS